MKDPQRLSLSPEFGLRDELNTVLGVDADYDVAGGLARFQTTLGSSLPLDERSDLRAPNELREPLSLRGTEGALPSVAPQTTASLLAKFALFGASVVGIGAVALALRNPASEPSAVKKPVAVASLVEVSSDAQRDATSTRPASEATPLDELPNRDPESTELAVDESPRLMRDAERVKRTSTGEDAPALSDSELSLEMRELREMRRFLATSPEMALALAANTRFPKGAFRPERTVIEIEAYVRLGRTAQANATAEAFFQREPRHPEIARLRRLTGIAEAATPHAL